MNHQKFDALAIEYDFVSEIFNNNDFFLSNLSVGRQRALDVGCGSGILMNALSDYYEEVVGIDISDPMLQIGRAKRTRKNIQYLHMDAVDISLSGKFDLIVSRTTLHHIDDKVQVIEKLKSLLTDHGKLVILDNVSENPTPKRYLNVGGAYLDLIPNLIKYGVTRGIRIFKHSLSKDWLDHLDSDVYLSESQTKHLYQGVLPGNSLSRFHVFMGVVWEADHEKKLRREPLE